MAKNLCRFIIPIIIAVVFINGIEKVESTILDDYTIDSSTENIACFTDYSSTDFELCFPPQSSSANILRHQNTSKQTNTSHNHNLKFIKIGRIVNANIQNFTHSKSLIVHSLFIKPINRLISFGKLVI